MQYVVLCSVRIQTIYLYLLEQTLQYDVFLCIGSGVWLQQQNTYIQVEERQDISLTDSRAVVCVTSKGVVNSGNWYFLGEVATGEGMIVSDMIERDYNRGFVKLIIPTSTPNSRLGYYYCSIKIYTDQSNVQTVRHTIRISSTSTSTTTTTTASHTTSQKTTITTTTKSPITTTPLNTQTTLVPSTITTTTINYIPSIQIQLSYTPDYDTVFIGVDDVIVTCVAMSENSLQLDVSLFDVNNGILLKKETDYDGRVEINERIELVKGNLTYKCIAVTEIGSVEAFISVQVESELLEYNSLSLLKPIMFGISQSILSFLGNDLIPNHS